MGSRSGPASVWGRSIWVPDALTDKVAGTAAGAGTEAACRDMGIVTGRSRSL